MGEDRWREERTEEGRRGEKKVRLEGSDLPYLYHS